MNKVIDLRSALELLRNTPGQLIETDVPSSLRSGASSQHTRPAD